MSAQDFTDDQRRYLEGFVVGRAGAPRRAGAEAAGRGRWAGPARGARQGAPRRHGPLRGGRQEALARGEGQARRASLRCLRALQERERQGPVPQGHRQLPLALPRPVLRGADAELLHVPAAHSQRHPLALAVRRRRRSRRALRRRLRARHHARQSANSRRDARWRRRPHRGPDEPRPHNQGDGCRQHPQCHRLAHGRHRPAGADRHPSLCLGLAPPHPQRPLALRPAAQVQRRLRRRRRHSRAGGHQRHRLHGGDGGAKAPAWMPACGSGSASAASRDTRTSPSTATST